MQHAFTAVAEGAEFLVQAWRRIMQVAGVLEEVCVCHAAAGVVVPPQRVLLLCRRKQRGRHRHTAQLRSRQLLPVAPLQSAQAVSLRCSGRRHISNGPAPTYLCGCTE